MYLTVIISYKNDQETLEEIYSKPYDTITLPNLLIAPCSIKRFSKNIFPPINNAKVSDTLIGSRSNMKICKCKHDYWNDSKSNSVYIFLYKCLTSWFISDRCLIITFLGLPRPKMRFKTSALTAFSKRSLVFIKKCKALFDIKVTTKNNWQFYAF